MVLAQAQEVDEGAGVEIGRKALCLLDAEEQRLDRMVREEAGALLRVPAEAVSVLVRVVVHRGTCYNRRATARSATPREAGAGGVGRACS